MKWLWFLVYVMAPVLLFPAILGGMGKDAEEGAFLFAKIVFPLVFAYFVYFGFGVEHF